MQDLIENETNWYFDQWWQEKETGSAKTNTEIKIKAFLALVIIIGQLNG
jgi:hypothetical protein